MPLVEKRYAEALIGISEKDGSIDAYRQEFDSIVSLYNNEFDFRFFLVNPQIDIDTKKNIIKKLFEGKARTEMVNFLLLLLDKGRIKYLPGILEEYVKLADMKRNVLNLKIISAAPVDEIQIQRLKDKYRAAHNASDVKVEVKIDESLVGGIKVQIGDKVTDASIKGRMESLREILGAKS